MACFYCHHNDGVTTVDHGSCIECAKQVCIDPSLRPDKKFHATLCGCHCQDLVCKYDAARHVVKHGSRVSDCFPSVAIAAASAVLHAAVAESHEDRVGISLESSTVDAFNDFLNFIAPGYDELSAAFKRSSDVSSLDVGDYATIADIHSNFRFRPDFYSSGTIDKIVALAASTLLRAWVRWDFSRTPATRASLSPALVHELNESYLKGDETHYSPNFLVPFLAPAKKRLPPSIERALRDTSAPDSASDIADWMVSERQLMNAY